MPDTILRDVEATVDPGPGIALERELRRLLIAGCTVMLAAVPVLGQAIGWAAAGQWLAQSGLLWGFVYFQARRRLDLNRPDPAAAPYVDLGPANRLTLLRGWLIAGVGGFLFQPWPDAWLAWVPAVLYTFAAIIDRVDGYVARRSGHASLLGTEMDTVCDAMGLAVAPLLAVWYGQIHWSYLLLSAAYYLFQWGSHARRKSGRPVHRLPANPSRRAWAGFQMGFIAVILYPVLPAPPARLAGVAFMLPVLIGFTIDWLIVSGRIDPAAPAPGQFFDRAQVFSQSVFQPALRLLAAVLLWVVAGGAGYSLQAGWAAPDIWMICGFIAGACLLLAGIAGRTAALGLIALLAWHFHDHVVDWPAGLLLFCLIWLLLLGPGRYSLWRRDDDWVNRYDGA